MFTHDAASLAAIFATISGERLTLDLYAWNAPAWYSESQFKRTAPNMIGSLVEAAGRLVREKKPVDPSQMVAALHFGFWTQLLKSGPDGNYVRHFWNAGLSKAFRHFPGGSRRSRGSIDTEIRVLKDFRNRVAHDEPIHNKKPDHQYERIVRVAGWIDPTLAGWIGFHARCPSLLKTGPTSTAGF